VNAHECVRVEQRLQVISCVTLVPWNEYIESEFMSTCYSWIEARGGIFESLLVCPLTHRRARSKNRGWKAGTRTSA
jgi:hypothetical protein